MKTLPMHTFLNAAAARTAFGGDSGGKLLPLLPFPEKVFPATGVHLADYLRLRQWGFTRMSKQRVVIAGICRNIAPILPATILRIERLASLFKEARVVIYENDSTDSTKLMIMRWMARDPRVTAVTENLGDPVNPVSRCSARAARMAKYRSRCQEMILDRYRDFDTVVLVDMDLLGGWSEDGIANTFGHDGWDMVGANGLIFRRSSFVANELRQYDIWAYRHEGSLQPCVPSEVSKIVPQRGQPFIRVASCFGGVGIYRMEAFAGGSYDGNDCEHVAFHHSLVKRGFSRIFMNPSQITIYGRRHRTTDPAVRLLLRAWSKFNGSPMQTWEHPAGFLPAESESDLLLNTTAPLNHSAIHESRYRPAA